MAVGGVEDVALGYGEVGGDCGLGDAAFEEGGGEFGGGAGDWGGRGLVVGWLVRESGVRTSCAVIAGFESRYEG